MTDMMVCFRCCITEQPQPQRRRRQIDRSMIGAPTDFRHTGHVGAGEVGRSNGCSSLRSMQKQMQSKGGYEYQTDVNVEIKTSDIIVRES